MNCLRERKASLKVATLSRKSFIVRIDEYLWLSKETWNGLRMIDKSSLLNQKLAERSEEVVDLQSAVLRREN